MCGLLALFIDSKHGFTNLEAKAFGEALYMDALRGEDATGIVLVDNEGETQIVKDNTSSSVFLTTPGIKTIFNRAVFAGKALLGHNRKKTSGTNLDTDAHPFIVKDRYVFMHNGTLSNHHEIGKFSVDSESLANYVVEHSDDKQALEEVFSKVQGAYACIWLDTKTETVYWIRNAERPLYSMTFPAGIALASEPNFMEVALNRNYIVTKDVVACKVNTLYSLQLENKLVVKEEDLSIKKAPPPFHMGASTTKAPMLMVGQTKTEANMANAGVSKNKFRALKRRVLNKSILFWVDDYIEGNYTDTAFPDIKREWLVFGSSEFFNDPRTVISGTISGQTQEDILNKWDGKFCSGIVEEIIYHEKDKTFSVNLKDIKLVPSAAH